VRLAIEAAIDDYEDVVTPGSDKRAALIEAIRAVERLQVQLNEELHLLVAEARHEGVSWGQIGRHLGCSRQAAHQRFGNGLSPERLKVLDEQLAHARVWAEEIDLKHGDDESFDRAITFLEQQEILDQELPAYKRSS
jgi:hypothetical protein